ncbi:MAG: VWA domain-containing protein [Treponema sp.]|jgi:uncharacterized protein with von Willebrand factor type A (vWA) domain|nr:VWA domain-containing protein [Treponema sp.]
MAFNPFNHFITFGEIADESARKQLAEILYNRLQTGKDDAVFSNADTGNTAGALENILRSSKTMRELCAKDPSLAEQVTQETLDFINKSKRQFAKTENPFDKEQALLTGFERIEESGFDGAWEESAAFLRETYEPQTLDIDFYAQQFQESLTAKPKAGKSRKRKRLHFESVKELFTEKWGGLLTQKQLKRELAFIDEQRKKFCEELYRRIEELKKLQELLAPFTGELGRLWDMSRGHWQNINFDILKKYAELLQKDASLQELAEMLGRMRQAEKEFEEEIFHDIVIKPEWKVTHAGKADLVGIHESDDISSMLPAEAALLGDETTELLFYKKFAEKKLQTFQYQAKILSYREEEIQNKRQKEKEEKKGPFIICVDTSGSMHGTPEAAAKTLCFALLKTAIRDNRKCYLISFSTGIETLNLTDIKNNLDKLIAFLSMSFHGGTDAAPAMKEALRMLETEDYKKADVIVVSDFVMPGFDEQTQGQIKAARDNKTKFHSLVIGGSGNKSVIHEFDNNWVYDISDRQGALRLVQNIHGL